VRSQRKYEKMMITVRISQEKLREFKRILEERFPDAKIEQVKERPYSDGLGFYYEITVSGTMVDMDKVKYLQYEL
jgi:hypothetical protein